jgi:3-oxoacyl-[acyl-carrier-protein] synthase II
MKAAIIAGSEAVSALGDSVDAMWPRLCAGESSAAPILRFDTSVLSSHQGASIPWLSFGEGENPVCQLMQRALDRLGPVPPDTSVIWCGIKGTADYVERVCEGRKPHPVYLSKHYRQWVCRSLGLQDRGLDVNAACTSSTVGLALAARMISRSQASSVLVCAADIVSRFIFTGFAAMGALSPTVCRPFDIARNGLLIGEGATAILVCNQETAEAQGRVPLAALTGWGIANDANHITGPAPEGTGLIRSIREALRYSRLGVEEVEAFCAHGTGTVYNDAMELTALESIFGSRRFPVFSIKGAIGHTMGAAGGLESAIAIRSLHERMVPATAGLVQVEERGTGRISSGSQPFAGNSILTTNSGFGGCNAALIFQRI